jgi:agmatine deiminase
MSWRMPSETAPQDRVWMAFPPGRSYIAESATMADRTRAVWSAVANTTAEFEPVTMLVDPNEMEIARGYVSASVDLVETPLNDAWMRDIGPTFVLDENERLGSVEWVFNGWGQQEWANWDLDAQVGGIVSRLAGAASLPSDLVNEGGGIHVDGLGTVLVTESVQLDPKRNPNIDKRAVEAELARTIGADHVIWLPRGLTRDTQEFGTRGHVDLLATVPSSGRLLVHVQTDPTHPDYAVTDQILDVLRDSRDVTGARWDIVELPAPTALRDDEGWVDYSYVNHLVVNGGVIGCAFADERDEQAREILGTAYPGRDVVMIDARAIFAVGGGIHCITQQQPRILSEAVL